MKPHVLMLLGGGGHTTEMVSLLGKLGDACSYTFVLPRGAAVPPELRQRGSVRRVLQPRTKRSGRFVALLRTSIATLESLWVLVRVRPQAIVSSGPGIAVPMTLLAPLVGARTIFIETASRVTSLSMTGRILRPRVDLFFVQWPELVEDSGIDQYAGRLL